ncbi:hypothetical protein BT63DRAFT_444063 [Microthyrium microscopicum]|uniref:Alpha/beta-hydrolase n=1 Tax=Microthyrium microscopicum TaxID=703497 RepID=A0A6A6TZ82_9PEZI|nr:hypothetical protein BT63DRAFT_444063 [Microthyrium microscopicum]
MHISATTTLALAGAATAQKCSPLELIYARATTEAPKDITATATPEQFDVAAAQFWSKGYGAAGYSLFTNITALIPSATGYPVHYPANWDSATSAPTGVKDMLARLESQAKACPQQKFVLGGHSQGSGVTVAAIPKISPELLARVVAVTMFGGRECPEAVTGRCRSFCNAGDMCMPGAKRPAPNSSGASPPPPKDSSSAPPAPNGVPKTSPVEGAQMGTPPPKGTQPPPQPAAPLKTPPKVPVAPASGAEIPPPSPHTSPRPFRRQVHPPPFPAKEEARAKGTLAPLSTPPFVPISPASGAEIPPKNLLMKRQTVPAPKPMSVSPVEGGEINKTPPKGTQPPPQPAPKAPLPASPMSVSPVEGGEVNKIPPPKGSTEHAVPRVPIESAKGAAIPATKSIPAGPPSSPRMKRQSMPKSPVEGGEVNPVPAKGSQAPPQPAPSPKMPVSPAEGAEVSPKNVSKGVTKGKAAMMKRLTTGMDRSREVEEQGHQPVSVAGDSAHTIYNKDGYYVYAAACFVQRMYVAAGGK